VTPPPRGRIEVGEEEKRLLSLAETILSPSPLMGEGWGEGERE